LEVSVVSEARVVQHDSLKKLNQLVRKLGSHERLHGARDFIGVFRLWKGGGNNLVNDLLSVLVLRWENLGPEGLILPLYQVPGLHSVEEVFVGNFDELLVTLSPCSLVSSEGEVRVPLLAVLTDDLGVVVLVVDEEALWVLVDVDVDLSQGVVECRLLDSFVVPLLEPSLEHSKLAPALEFLDQFWDWADSDGVEKLLDVDFVTIQLKKGTENLWSGVLVHFEEIDLDELVLLVVVKIPGELVNEVMHVAEVDKGSWVW